MILTLHTLSTLSLCGLIWFVQVVHYPLFTEVGRLAPGPAFHTFATLHQKLTSIVVVPLMLAELTTATALWLQAPHSRLTSLGLLLLVVIWASTALLQVPQHRRLSLGYDDHAARRLIRTNWIRTGAWTARAAIALVFAPPTS